MRFAIILVLAACTHDEHHIEAAWTVDRLDSGQVACPQGWTTARLISVDPADSASQIVDTFPCSDGQGVSSYLAADSYTSWIELTDGDKTFAASPHTTVPVTSFNPDLLADIYLDAGWVQLAWSACADQLAIDLTGSDDVTTVFSCSETQGVVGPLAPGTYHASVSTDAFSEVLSDVTVEPVNHVTDLGVVTLGD